MSSSSEPITLKSISAWDVTKLREVVIQNKIPVNPDSKKFDLLVAVRHFYFPQSQTPSPRRKNLRFFFVVRGSRDRRVELKTATDLRDVRNQLVAMMKQTLTTVQEWKIGYLREYTHMLTKIVDHVARNPTLNYSDELVEYHTVAGKWSAPFSLDELWVEAIDGPKPGQETTTSVLDNDDTVSVAGSDVTVDVPLVERMKATTLVLPPTMMAVPVIPPTPAATSLPPSRRRATTKAQ